MTSQKPNIKINKETLNLLKSMKTPKLKSIEAVILDIIEENEKLKQENNNLITILKNTR